MPRGSSIARFWSRIDRSGDCWLWTGAASHGGYGLIKIGDVFITAHRCAWWIATGERPPRGTCVLHLCDQPRCVRPGHLMLGDHAENNRQARERGRWKPVPRGPPRYFEHEGVTLHIAGWAARLGISRERMRQRVNAYGWPAALTHTRGAA